jgi:transcriptional regulator with XRE-family HTH domain
MWNVNRSCDIFIVAFSHDEGAPQMSQVITNPHPSYGFGFLMPAPGPLGRLVRRRRGELGLTQPELSDRTAQYGVRVPQNLISRLESGRTNRVNDIARLDALGKALGFESYDAFIMAAYAPGVTREERASSGARDLSALAAVIPGPQGELVALIKDLPDRDAFYLLRIAKAMVQDDVQPDA